MESKLRLPRNLKQRIKKIRVYTSVFALILISSTLGGILYKLNGGMEQDWTPPSWDEIPIDQMIEFSSDHSYDVNASDHHGISQYWVNDTVHFAIDTDGVLTSVTSLAVGNYLVEIRAYDPSGNYCSAIIKFTVQDTLAPVWNPNPTDWLILFGDGNNILSYDVNATDAAGIDYYWINDTTRFDIDANGLITSRGILPVGEYRVIIRAYDPSGNNCSEIIYISSQDTHPPKWQPYPGGLIVFSDGPTLISYDTNAVDGAGIHHYWINDTILFNIDTNGLITSRSSLAVGEYWLEIRAYDPSDNYCSANPTIKIIDVFTPEWNPTPYDQVLQYGNTFSYDLNAIDGGGIAEYWINDTALFEVDTYGLITSREILAIGNYWVEVRAIDASGNFCSATIMISVSETTAPIWNPIPADQCIEYGDAFFYDVNAVDAAGIAYYWVNDTEYFGVDEDGLIKNKSILNVGEYVLEIRAYNPDDEFSSAIIIITVQDTQTPAWNPIPISSLIVIGSNTILYDVNATDLSGISLYWINDTMQFEINEDGLITSKGTLPYGTYDLEVRAYDPYNNYCSAIISISLVDVTNLHWNPAPTDP